ncbi:phage shock protein C (PspC) family protein [Sanguibacter antarcticus]|uniref:Phage shock protein C (PspC) family protein n=1 Tax=Sanguibacter antarcticus TaxID=372484 RepID=A0A2A9E5U6_9MICO|nr:phage shock protein C (PspC) family protein [Sanguibacter antarcticus]
MRLPLRRPPGNRLLGGVCLGAAAHLDLPVRSVRFMATLLALAGGLGVVAYVFLWVTVPTGDPVAIAAEQRDPALTRIASRSQPAWSARGQDRWANVPVRDILVGSLLVVAAVALVASRLGVTIEWSWVLPVLIALVGVAIAWSQLDESERGRWLTRAGGRTPNVVLRLTGGIVLVLVGVLLLVSQDMSGSEIIPAVVAALAVLAGVALVLAPWWLRLRRELGEERAARERANERADIAAHLHDSVLQTLALIQRSSARSGEVTRLARNQERELREWLYQDRPAAGTSLAADVTTLVAEVENTLTERSGGDEPVSIDVVVVGDCPPSEATSALLQAAREALVNAVVHGGPPVSLYLEVSEDAAEVYVRDRGTGFDVDLIPHDRFGVRESIIGRVQRKGGDATVVSHGDRGTEIALRMPLADTNHKQSTTEERAR